MENLLSQMVTAYKQLQPKTQPFTLYTFRGDGKEEQELWHEGLPAGSIQVSSRDLDSLYNLVSRGLIKPSGHRGYELTQKGLNYFK